MAWANSTRNRRNPPGWYATRRRIMVRDQGLCQIRWDAGCTVIATQVDDIIPTTDPGWHGGDDNYQAACAHCNARKNIAQRPTPGPSRRLRPAERHPGTA